MENMASSMDFSSAVMGLSCFRYKIATYWPVLPTLGYTPNPKLPSQHPPFPSHDQQDSTLFISRYLIGLQPEVV